MSVLIKGEKMPRNCHECDSIGFSDLVSLVCPANSGWRYDNEKRPDGCPLVEVPPHGDLIDKRELYDKARELESEAMARLEKFGSRFIPDMHKNELASWQSWSAILAERTAFKLDIADAPVVIKAEGEQDERTD